MRRFLAAMLLCAVTVLGAGASGLAGATDPTERLLDVSGLRVQLTNALYISRAAVLESLAQIGVEPATLRVLQRRVAEVLSPEAFLAAVASELQSTFAAGEIEELLAWFESDLGRKITAAEENASAVDAQLDMLLQAETLVQDAERTAVVRRMLEVVRGTDLAVAQASNLMLLTIAAGWGIEHAGVPFNLTGLRVYVLPAFEESIRQSVEESTLLAYLYTYRDIDLSDLEQYTAFLETPVSLKLNDALDRALNRQYELAALALAEASSAVIEGRTVQSGAGPS
jgi:hypothetical protein